MGAPLIEMVNINKVVKSKEILKNINIEIHSGDIIGIIGPNGAGKTTLLKILLGLSEPTKGKILISGKDINYKEFLSNVGAVIENPTMYPFLSGWTNLKLTSRMNNKTILKEEIESIIHFFELDKDIHKTVKHYSLGMKQRLGLAQAMLHDPSILILDEPTNGLDPKGIHELRNYIKQLCSKGKTIIISSHLLAEIEAICDRILIMQEGTIISENITDYRDKTSLSIIVSDTEKAVNILNSQGINSVTSNNKELYIETTPEDVANILNLLSKNNIFIYSTNLSSVTLEDRFLELTGGNR